LGTLSNRPDGIEKPDSDAAVLAEGFIPGRKLYQEVKRKVSEVYLVGDFVEPRKIREAIAEGYQTGLMI
jgi:hypothetical protein